MIMKSMDLVTLNESRSKKELGPTLLPKAYCILDTCLRDDYNLLIRVPCNASNERSKSARQ